MENYMKDDPKLAEQLDFLQASNSNEQIMQGYDISQILHQRSENLQEEELIQKKFRQQSSSVQNPEGPASKLTSIQRWAILQEEIKNYYLIFRHETQLVQTNVSQMKQTLQQYFRQTLMYKELIRRRQEEQVNIDQCNQLDSYKFEIHDIDYFQKHKDKIIQILKFFYFNPCIFAFLLYKETYKVYHDNFLDNINNLFYQNLDHHKIPEHTLFQTFTQIMQLELSKLKKPEDLLEMFHINNMSLTMKMIAFYTKRVEYQVLISRILRKPIQILLQNYSKISLNPKVIYDKYLDQKKIDSQKKNQPLKEEQKSKKKLSFVAQMKNLSNIFHKKKSDDLASKASFENSSSQPNEDLKLIMDYQEKTLEEGVQPDEIDKSMGTVTEVPITEQQLKYFMSILLIPMNQIDKEIVSITMKKMNQEARQLINVINHIIDSIIESANNFPKGIKVLLKIITTLIKQKFPKVQESLLDKVFLTFFFVDWIIPELLLYIKRVTLKDGYRKIKQTIKLINQFMHKVIHQEFYENSLECFNNLNKFIKDIYHDKLLKFQKKIDVINERQIEEFTNIDNSQIISVGGQQIMRPSVSEDKPLMYNNMVITTCINVDDVRTFVELIEKKNDYLQQIGFKKIVQTASELKKCINDSIFQNRQNSFVFYIDFGEMEQKNYLDKCFHYPTNSVKNDDMLVIRNKIKNIMILFLENIDNLHLFLKNDQQLTLCDIFYHYKSLMFEQELHIKDQLKYKAQMQSNLHSNYLYYLSAEAPENLINNDMQQVLEELEVELKVRIEDNKGQIRVFMKNLYNQLSFLKEVTNLLVQENELVKKEILKQEISQFFNKATILIKVIYSDTQFSIHSGNNFYLGQNLLQKQPFFTSLTSIDVEKQSKENQGDQCEVKICQKFDEFLTCFCESKYVQTSMQTGQNLEQLNQLFNTFMGVVSEKLDNHFKGLDQPKLQIIYDSVEKLICRVVYHKIYPKEQTAQDKKFYRHARCCSFISYDLLDIQKEAKDSHQMWIHCSKLLNQINEQQSMLEKIQVLQEVNSMITQIQTIAGLKRNGADYMQPYIILIILLAQPKRIYSNINFMQVFFHKMNWNNGGINFYLTQLTSSVQFIEEINKGIQMSPDEFEKKYKEIGDEIDLEEKGLKNDFEMNIQLF